MIVRVFFRESVLLPNNRRERFAHRTAPAGQTSFDVEWHKRGISLRLADRQFVYPDSMIEFVEEWDETAIHTITPIEVVALSDAPKRGRRPNVAKA
jgi:hypothetical protein